MNNDLISRKALIKAIKTECNPYGKPTIDFVSGLKALNIIENAPTVEPEITDDDLKAGMTESYHIGYELAESKFNRPTGEWLPIGEEQGALGIVYKIIKCSSCGWEHSLMLPDNYCPNCGAAMRGERK